MSASAPYPITYPPEKLNRVIINTDAKNEADDQFAIVHALLTPSFELHGFIPDQGSSMGGPVTSMP